jgi:VWFA-related protein
MPRIVSSLSLIAIASVSLALPAQQPLSTDTARPPSAAPIIFDVVVRDKSGEPVRGLRPQDFTVLDNGVPTKILSFRPPDPPSAPPQVDPSTEVILILDEVNAPYTAVTYARDGIRKFLLQNNGELTHPVSLAFLNNNGLQVQTTPAVDGTTLAAALAQEQRSFRVDERGTGFYGAEDRMKQSMDALDSLIAGEKKTGYRKLVIWISPGWPLLSGPNIDLSDNQKQHIFHSAVNLTNGLRQARIVLYNADPLGPEGFSNGSLYYENFTGGLQKTKDAQLGDISLQALEVQTGGRAIFGNAAIESSIDHCVSDIEAMYTLSIASAPSDRPNDFHQITVKVAPPGLKVRTRDGYYAQP